MKSNTAIQEALERFKKVINGQKTFDIMEQKALDFLSKELALAEQMGYRQGIKDYVDYEYIDWQSRSDAHKGTIIWLDYVVKKLLEFKKGNQTEDKI